MLFCRSLSSPDWNFRSGLNVFDRRALWDASKLVILEAQPANKHPVKVECAHRKHCYPETLVGRHPSCRVSQTFCPFSRDLGDHKLKSPLNKAKPTSQSSCHEVALSARQTVTHTCNKTCFQEFMSENFLISCGIGPVWNSLSFPVNFWFLLVLQDK